MSADYAIGRRIAELRARRGMTQEGLAEASGVSISVIRRLEQETGGARLETLHKLARALEVNTMVFVPPATTAPEPATEQERRDIVLAELRSVISPPVGLHGPIRAPLVDEGAPNLDRLGQAARSLFDAYHADRYDDVAALAPGLIRSAEYHVGTVDERRRRDAVRLRGDLLGVTGRYLVQIRAHDLALTALRDAIRDAEEAGDQALAVSAIGSQAWVMLRQARFDEVEQLCAAVADSIEPRMSSATPEELAAWGWTLLRASAAAARNNRPERAREYVGAASAAAARLGVEHQDLAGHRPFGPLTVAIQGPENELVAGHPDRALELVERLPRDVGETSRSGWNRHQLDQARALVRTGQTDRATDVLTALQRRSGNWMRHQRLARDVVRELVAAKKRSLTEDQRALADSVGLDL